MAKSISELLSNAELQSRENAALLIQLQAKMAMMAAIVENTDDAVISKTLEGTILYWNHGSELLFGYSAEEAVGQMINLIVPSEKTEQELKVVDETRHGKVVHFETVRRRKNGELFDVSVTATPTRDFSDIVIGVSNIERDITLEKQLQNDLIRINADLKESNDRFFRIFEYNPVAMSLSNLETGKLENINEVFRELFGFTKEEAIGKTSVELDIFSKKQRGDIIELLKKEDILKGIELLARKKSGVEFWALASTQIIYIHGDKFVASSFQDISERKRNEQNLQEQTKELQRENVGLEGQNKELERKNEENQNAPR